MSESSVLPGLEVGEEVADVELVERMSAAAGVALFRARRADGGEATVVAAEGLDEAGRDRLLAAASSVAERIGDAPLPGVPLPIAIDPVAAAYVVDVVPTGTVADIPLLNWTADQLVELLREVSKSLQRLHEAGIIHGGLRPELIVLDDALGPHVVAADGIDAAEEYRASSPRVEVLRPYTAPEVRHGRSADSRADVYALGRILHFLLLGSTPDERDEAVPRLDSIAQGPPGLVRIVRKCTVADPERRYQSPAELDSDFGRYLRDRPVGLRHPDVDAPEDGGEGTTGSHRARQSSRPSSTGSWRSHDSSRPSSTGSWRARDSSRPSSTGSWRARDSSRPGPPRAAFLSRRRKGWWSPAVAGVALLLGSALLVGAIIGGRAREDAGAFHFFFMALVSPFFLALVPPPISRKPWLLRLSLVVLGAGLIIFLDPTQSLDEKAPPIGRLQGASVADRVVALERLKEEGETFFMQNDLAGADLSKRDLAGLALDGSNLEGCDCRGTRFTNTSMLNVEVTAADFSGADLSGVLAAFLIDFGRAKCDATTVMPAGWICQNGAPTPVVAP